MIHFSSKIFSIAIVSGFLLNNSVEAICSKCQQIEEARAKEQAANPQPTLYYEDYQKQLSATKQKQQIPPQATDKQRDVIADLNDSYSTSQTQYRDGLDNSSTPNMSDEKAFINQSNQQYQQMNQSNQNMINRDRGMIREGYDPNEKYFGGSSSSIQGDSYSYPNQEQVMRGQGINNKGQ